MLVICSPGSVLAFSVQKGLEIEFLGHKYLSRKAPPSPTYVQPFLVCEKCLLLQKHPL